MRAPVLFLCAFVLLPLLSSVRNDYYIALEATFVLQFLLNKKMFYCYSQPLILDYLGYLKSQPKLKGLHCRRLQ